MNTTPAPVLPPLPEHQKTIEVWVPLLNSAQYQRTNSDCAPLEPHFTADQMREYALAAIKAIQGDAVDYVLDLLVAAGHIARETAFHARDIAREFHPAAIRAKDQTS